MSSSDAKAQSCDHCSRRRRRCDRGTPCSLCRSLGRPCTYARQIQKRGPKKGAKRAAEAAETEAGDSPGEPREAGAVADAVPPAPWPGGPAFPPPPASWPWAPAPAAYSSYAAHAAFGLAGPGFAAGYAGVPQVPPPLTRWSPHPPWFAGAPSPAPLFPLRMPPPQRPADPPASPASAGSDNPAWWGVVMGPDAVRGSPGSDLALKSPKSNLTLASSSALALPPARSASAGSDHLDFASFSTGSFAAVGGMPATVPPQPTGPFQVTVPLQASAQTSTLAGIPTMVGSGASSAASMAKLLSLSQLSTSPVSPLAPSLPSHLTLMDDLPPLPDAGILRYLVEAYFSTIGASLPIFHRPTFSAALAQQPLFLVWIMAAIAIPFLPHHLSSSPLSRRLLAAMPAEAHSALRPPARRALQTNLVERSRRVLLRIAEATPVGGGAEVGPAFRLAKMAGLVLLGMASAFRFYKGAVEFTDAVTRLAIDEARALGLNLAPPNGTAPRPEGHWIADETARRLWYTMYLSDQVASLGLNRPAAIGPEECLAPAPRSDAAYETESTAEPGEVPMPAELVFDTPDGPPVRADGLLESEWALSLATTSAVASVVDWQRRMRARNLEFFLPRLGSSDPAWKDAFARFRGLAAMLERLYWKLPAWLRELDADPAGFLADPPAEVASADPAAVARAVYSLTMLHAAQCCLHSPPAPASEHRETQAWMAHGRPDPAFFETGDVPELAMVPATASARRAGRAAFAGFPVEDDPADPSGFLTSPAALCFFHQRRRAALARGALLPLDPDVIIRNGLQAIMGLQLFMLRLLLRGMYIERAIGILADAFIRERPGGALGDAEAAELVRRAREEGEREAWADLEAHVAESEPGAMQHRAGAAGLQMARMIMETARRHPPGEGSFAGLRYSTFGALGGELRELVMRALLNGPDRAEPGVEGQEAVDEAAGALVAQAVL